jgi:hypothetical protein
VTTAALAKVLKAAAASAIKLRFISTPGKKCEVGGADPG